MPNLLTTEQKERYYLAGLVAVGLLRFVNLGFLDLQAWDEALYAVRAEGILMFGGLFDQTPFAIGGLYSSLHPPLYVWLTSLSFLLFGVTEFAARFFSAVFGALTLLVIYRIGKEIDSAKLGFIAAMLYGLNSFVTFLARQGQFDTTLVFFLTLSIFFYLKLGRNGESRFAIFAGLAVGAALMTKLFVALGVPLTFFLWKLSIQRREEATPWTPFVVSLGVAFLVAAPWYIFMTITRGSGNPLFFLDASAVIQRSLTGVEGNIKPLEALYFVNQLFVLFPLGVIWFGYGIYQVLREREQSWFLLGLWFAVFFVVFSLMRTKLAVYALPMLVPASLIASKVITELGSGSSSNRLGAVLLGSTGVSFLWASNQEWRDLTKSILAQIFTARLPVSQALASFLPFLVLLCCTILLVYLMFKNDTIQRALGVAPILVLLPSFLLTFYDIIGRDQFQYVDGASALARFVEERQPSEIFVAGFDRNPQLTYYMDGADIGWRDDITIRRATPPPVRSEIRNWLSQQASDLPADALVVVEKDKFIRYEWVTAEEVNPFDFSLVFDSRRYAAFQRMPATQFARLTPGGLASPKSSSGKE